MPINHVSLPVSDLDKALPAYLEALEPLGYKVFKKFPGIVGLRSCPSPDFWICQASATVKGDNHDGSSPTIIPAKVHVAFDTSSRAVVRKFHEAATKAGFTDNGAPGLRPQYVDGYYAAFVNDQDGNNIECVCFSPWWFVALQMLKPVAYFAALGLAYWVGRKGFP